MKKKFLTLCLAFLIFSPKTIWASLMDEDIDPVRMKRAWCYHNNGQSAKAIETFEQVAAAHPGHAGPYYYMGYPYRDLGLFEQAIQRFIKAKELNPAAPAIDYIIAESYYLEGIWDLRNGHSALAVEHFQKGIAANPQFAANFYWIGLTFFYQSKYAQAIPWLEKARAAQPSDFHVHRDLGLCYLKLGLWDQARLELEQAIHLNPASFSAHYNLGLLYSRMGFWSQAWQEFYLAVTMGESMDTFKPYF